MSEQGELPRRLPSRRGGGSRRGPKPAERSEALARREEERLPSRRGGGSRRGSKPAERSEALARREEERLPSRRGGGSRRGPKPAERSEALARREMSTSILVIGTGLIGTSIALAMRERAGATVWLADADPSAAKLAADMGGGRPHAGEHADIAVLAVPPEAVAATLADAQARGLARCYTDVASVKRLPVTQARAAGCDMTTYVPGHPLAGREKHGPAAARADLFLGRTWALCPSPGTDSFALASVVALAEACGAETVRTDPVTHDRWVALTSHAPHLVAAAMATRLEHADSQALDLAGQGMRDVTRIAAGDTALWTQILTANAGPVADVIDAVAADLAQAARLLADGEGQKVAALLDAGQAGVRRIPGKHGWQQRDLTTIQVVIRDQPGELARLFNAAGSAGVNIEDIRIEHSPGLPVGVAELSVRQAETAPLLAALDAGGWPVRNPLFSDERTVVCGTRMASVGRASRIPAEVPHGKRQACHCPCGEHEPVAARDHTGVLERS
jgi:prephenate dehydrogenase